MRVITLLTDYGLRDPYVAELKGAILRIAPGVTLVDITHMVDGFNVREGAFSLARSVPYFPDGAIHVGVVDPGVGGKRKGIIVEAKGATLVGPDNGLLAPAAERLGVVSVHEIADRSLLPPRVSYVFDGRDTFGPVAALTANGVDPARFGPELKEYVRLPAYDLTVRGGAAEATVIHVDGFGNVVTNITYAALGELGVAEGSEVAVETPKGKFILPYVRSFSEAPAGAPLALVAGGGYLELAVNMGSAQKALGLGLEDKLRISPARRA